MKHTAPASHAVTADPPSGTLVSRRSISLRQYIPSSSPPGAGLRRRGDPVMLDFTVAAPPPPGAGFRHLHVMR